MEWLEDLELTSELCEITKVEWVLPLWLKGVARETYWWLSKAQRDDIEEIKHALIKAYGTDSFVAFEQFNMRCLHPEETVDEFLTDFQWLVRLVGGMPPECWMKSAFVNGLPSHVRGLLQSSTRIETLTLRELLERACAILGDTKDEHLAAAVWPEQALHTPNLHKTGQSDVNCFRWGVSNHLARDCFQRSSVRNLEREISHALLSLQQNCAPNEKLSGETKQGQNVSAALFPFKLRGVVNGEKHMALVDSGCSWLDRCATPGVGRHQTSWQLTVRLSTVMASGLSCW